jgi:SH3-like domain-containing protein
MRHHAAARTLAATVVAVAAWSGAVSATEFRSVAQPAVLYDGPSRQARKVFAAPRGMPLEVIAALGTWIKVRDVSGDVVWIERSELGERRSVVTTVLATVRREPQDAAAVVLLADRGVLLDVVEGTPSESVPGWVRVRHRDGEGGWVRTAEVWGV